MQTLATPCRSEETIKRSRFIAHAAPIDNQADTLDFFAAVADPSASHNCWAWRVEGIHRFNDDGEPGGSAGRPILGVIETRELDRVMVVVTRWFGGVKLGVGGLVRAYSGCAAKCLDGAELLALRKRLSFRLSCEHAHADTVHRLLAQFEAEKTGDGWGARGLDLQVEVDERRFAGLCAALRDATRGQVTLGRPSAV